MVSLRSRESEFLLHRSQLSEHLLQAPPPYPRVGGEHYQVSSQVFSTKVSARIRTWNPSVIIRGFSYGSRPDHDLNPSLSQHAGINRTYSRVNTLPRRRYVPFGLAHRTQGFTHQGFLQIFSAACWIPPPLTAMITVIATGAVTQPGAVTPKQPMVPTGFEPATKGVDEVSLLFAAACFTDQAEIRRIEHFS